MPGEIDENRDILIHADFWLGCDALSSLFHGLRRLFLRRFAGASLFDGSEHTTEGASARKASHHSREVRVSPLVSADRRRYARASANSGLLTMEEGRLGGILFSNG
jgi:hypothetical protein